MYVIIESVTTTYGQDRDIEGTLYEKITGFNAVIPRVDIGERMWILYPGRMTSRIHTTTVKEHTLDKSTMVHVVRTKNSIYTFRETGEPAKHLRLTATLYMESPLSKHFFDGEPSPNGYLYSYGKYPTKILPSVLPPWYVRGYMYKRQGYMSAKGVKHLLYVPNYTFNHLFKDDSLFISYDEAIEPTVSTDSGFRWYSGYKHVLSGSLIVDFVEAAAEYSDYDITEIMKEIEKKKAWYEEHYGK